MLEPTNNEGGGDDSMTNDENSHSPIKEETSEIN